jgi:serine/threonine protein kinase
MPFPPAQPADFEILGELGHGGMGVVYRAYDRKRREVVALKTMQWVDHTALDLFKKEFRAVADLVHPNLVALHELVWDGRLWFFTMELVEGVDFLSYVRGGVQGLCDSTLASQDTTGSGHPAGEVAQDKGEAAVLGGLTAEQIERLRDALGQLAEGVNALHRARRLHRDIKPSNVLVRRDRRVTLLDFGLAAEIDPSGLHRSAGRVVRGTLAYMSPEQAAGRPLSPASDWYSVGLMLFEALTGRRPSRGLDAADPVPGLPHFPFRPSTVAPGTPDDLDALCLDLLHPHAEGRPSGTEVLCRLGGRAERRATAPPAQAPLIGREPHLAFLEGRLADLAMGRTVVVRVHGASGTGKSTLVQRFLERRTGRDRVVALSGRCYEREAVPYKALDSLIDALGGYLRQIPRHEVEALLPRDVTSLARVFPALRGIEAASTTSRRGLDVPDQQELRRRAFSALRELLARLGDRRVLVLALDDLQWGDVDSSAVLAELLRGPDSPTFLLLACHRDEDVEASPFLSAFLELEARTAGSAAWHDLAVKPLSADDSRRLASELLEGAVGASRLPEAIGKESGGNPFFVNELVRSIREGDDVVDRPEAAGGVSLDGVIWSRITRLDDASRRLLEVVAVAGRPIRQGLAVRCAGLDQTDERHALATLKAGRLVRGKGLADREDVETYHDRVREAVVARLEAEVLRDRHGQLARVLEGAEHADSEEVGAHLLAADEPGRAAGYFARAAARAADALAFDRAVTLYRLAINLRLDAQTGAEEIRSLRRRLGDALANAGRGAEAASEYLGAVAGATVAEAFELRRLAAMQLLVSGHIDRGLDVLRDVLDSVGMALPATPLRALVMLLLRRALLRVRGDSFRRRDPSEIAPADLARIDVCWAAVAGLSVVDFIRGADFQERGLLLALRAGEPSRIARALAMEAAHAGTAGWSGRHRTARLLRRAAQVANEVGDPYALATLGLATGSAAYLEGRWRDALAACDGAERMFRDRCTGTAWELATTRSFALWSLSHLGELAELTRRWPVAMQEARERGDLYEVMNLSTYLMTVVRLAGGDGPAVRDELAATTPQWSTRGFHVQHNDVLWASTQVDLYLGDGPSAWDRIRATWPALSRSLLLTVQFIRVSMCHLRARCALAILTKDPRAGVVRRVAERDARALGREGAPWAVALSGLIRAALRAVDGDRPGALAGLAAAEESLAAVDMRLYSAAARRRRGELLGDAEGDRLVAEADAWMAAQGVNEPERMTPMYVPGFEAGRRGRG